MSFLSYNKCFIWCSVRPVMQLFTWMNRNATAFSLTLNISSDIGTILVKLLHILTNIKNFWVKVSIQPLVLVSPSGSFLGNIGRILHVFLILAMHVFLRTFYSMTTTAGHDRT